MTLLSPWRKSYDKTRQLIKKHKLGIKSPYSPAIPLLGTYPEETKIERDTCIPFFIATLFTIAGSNLDVH